MATLIQTLEKLDLVSWPVLSAGLRNGWIGRSDVVEFSDIWLQQNDDPDAILISGNSFELEDEFRLTLEKLSDRFQEKHDAMDILRLGHLVMIDQGQLSEQQKIDQLQEIYAMFNYPEDMVECCIYSSGNQDPLLALTSVIEQLKQNVKNDKI